jgi:UDP-N-acetyl-D-mannosaminuronate dehydrogenase
MKNNNVLIAGFGEVGSAIGRIEKENKNTVFVLDPSVLIIPGTSLEYEVLHICFPYSKDFENQCVKYIERYRPRLVIIHSTVVPGTTENIRKQTGRHVVHSFVRGVHPNLYEGINTFVKYVGGDDVVSTEAAVNYLTNLGLKVEKLSSSKHSEAAKIFDTSYYGWCILFTKETKKYCDEHGLNFEEVYTRPNITYNEGYEKLGMKNVVRPVLYPPSGEIGGHCVTNNFQLLEVTKLKKIFNELNTS